MNPSQAENKTEVKTEQAQTAQPVPAQSNVEAKTQEAAPDIKSEENKTNWRAFREQRERERKEREQAEKIAQEKAKEAEALRAALEAITNKANPLQRDEEEETEEQKIDKRVNALLAQREAEWERKKQQQDQLEMPQRLASTYSDFNKVCSIENLDYFEYHYPELAAPFANMPDNFDKWSSLYKAVKRFVPNMDAKQDQAKAEKNLAKPGSVSSTGTSQGAGVMPSARLDEARRAANWERMQRTMKGLS